MHNDVPIGGWTAGRVFDLLDALRINRKLRPAADLRERPSLSVR